MNNNKQDKILKKAQQFVKYFECSNETITCQKLYEVMIEMLSFTLRQCNTWSVPTQVKAIIANMISFYYLMVIGGVKVEVEVDKGKDRNEMQEEYGVLMGKYIKYLMEDGEDDTKNTTKIGDA